MSTISGIDEITTRTLDGLSSIDVDTIIIDGSPFDPTDYLNKVTDTSDNIVEGIANLFLTPTERSEIAANTANRHDPVTIGIPNGLSLSTQVLSLETASGITTGALTSTDWNTFNGKQDTITGAGSTITSANLTASRALVSDGSGKVAVSTVTSTELGYVSGVTSSIQSQIDALAGSSPWQEIVTPSGSFIRTYTTPATVEVNNRLAVVGDGTFTGSLQVGAAATINGSLTTGVAGIYANGPNTRFIGTDHVYQEFYPRGLAAGRKAYIGYGGSNSTTLVISNVDTNNTVTVDGYLTADRTIDGEHGIRTWNYSNGANAYSALRLNAGTSGVGILFKNNQTRTNDGGPHCLTLRNDQGDLRLQAQGSVGMTVQASTGIVTHTAGDTSYIQYGPNTSYGSYLRVGATGGNNVGENVAACVTTNGNLHLDCSTNTRSTYINYYANLSSDVNNVIMCQNQTFNFNVPLSRLYEAPTPIRLIMYNYNEISPVYYAPGVNFWGVLLPNIFQITVAPLRTSSRFLIRVKLSVGMYGDSSIAFRVIRRVGTSNLPINVGTGGINSGNSRMSPTGSSGYWMAPPTFIEVLDHPNTTSTVTYFVEYMTYSPAYGFRLNLPNPGNNQGGDATAVTSTMVVEERAYAEYSARVATSPP